MKPDRVSVRITKTLPVQPALELIRVTSRKIPEKCQRINIRKILMGRGDELSLCASRQRGLDIRGEQPESGFLNEAHRKIKPLAEVQVFAEFINEFEVGVVGVECGAHG